MKTFDRGASRALRFEAKPCVELQWKDEAFRLRMTVKREPFSEERKLKLGRAIE